MAKSKLYTRQGDKGTTTLTDGKKLAKDDLRICAYGTTDELNAHVGLLLPQVRQADLQIFLTTVQQRLFEIGSVLSAGLSSEPTFGIRALEEEIDRLDSALPPLRDFILPGGCPAACQAHVCRTVCRRAERLVVSLSRREPVPPAVSAYMNRLSDYFFVLSRYLNFKEGVTEKIWQNSCK